MSVGVFESVTDSEVDVVSDEDREVVVDSVGVPLTLNECVGDRDGEPLSVSVSVRDKLSDDDKLGVCDAVGEPLTVLVGVADTLSVTVPLGDSDRVTDGVAEKLVD